MAASDAERHEYQPSRRGGKRVGAGHPLGYHTLGLISYSRPTACCGRDDPRRVDSPPAGVIHTDGALHPPK